MLPYNCIICGESVDAEYLDDGTIEPASRYWKGDDKNATFCSVECSFIEHRKIYEQNN